MLLAAIAARFAHGLLILAEPESSDPHDEWDPVSEPVHAGPDSLYIGVQPAATGLVRVECFDGTDHPADRIRIYSGQLQLKSQKFLLYDPDETVLLTVLTDSENVNVDIYSDDEDDPTAIQIFVNSVR